MPLRAYDFGCGFCCGGLLMGALASLHRPGFAAIFLICAVASFAISFWRFEIFKQ